tara:strand:- start:5463 stop:5759 length:297 start_codon:yes stop_codon:yes gene_type:complete
MKLSKLKVFQSVKVGAKEHTFLVEADFDMELKDNLVFITRKSDGSNVITPLTNTPWFVVSEGSSVPLKTVKEGMVGRIPKKPTTIEPKKPSKTRKTKG